MKKNRIFGMFAAGALIFSGACSNDVIDPGSQGGSDKGDYEDGMYLAVNFDLPSGKGTRSYTDDPNSSNSGTEVGKDYENFVKTVYVVLATTDNSFIAASQTETIAAVGTDGDSYRSTAKFTKTLLADYYDSDNFNVDGNGNHKINVFVFCNPTENLANVLDHAENGDKDWYNKLGVFQETTPNTGTDCIWKENYFLMSNAEICERLFPSSLAEWDNYSTESTAFNLSGMNNFGRPNEIDNYLEGKGNIPVERAAARYDFRDGALDGVSNEIGANYDLEGPNGFAAQKYHVVLDHDQQPLVDVFLGKMSLVNMNKEYYFLRRVSNNGRMDALMANGNPNDVTLCGPELPWYRNAEGGDLKDDNGNNINGNYVVDAFADWKYSGQNAAPTTGFSGKFNYPFFDEDGNMTNVDAANDRWNTVLIKNVLDGTVVDNPNSWNADGKKKEYKVWRYLTEGTIPGVSSQKNAVSNGIVFKGQMQPGREIKETGDDDFTKKLIAALAINDDANHDPADDPILYVFQNHIYCTWDHIRRVALSMAITDIKWDAANNKFTFEINRSSTLYNAVFGNGGFGEIKLALKADNTPDYLNVSSEDMKTLVDTEAQDVNSPNYLYNQWRDEPVLDEQFEAFRAAAVTNQIALYMTSYDDQLGGWGYYCYYYYWNRHNDNGQTGVMGPMEFAVVRNNVYKLAVTRLGRLGHPRVADNDPDKPTPNTPDEKADVYITVTCTTLPWVVRENNIVFN